MVEENVKQVRRQTVEVGVVTSTKGDKTIHVIINNLVKHAKYGKYRRRRTKLAVHDPANEAQLGDVVEVALCRRMSKSKSWRLARIVRRGDGVGSVVSEPSVEVAAAAAPEAAEKAPGSEG
jgi:small subunit ribosomal protein S17